MSSGPFLKVPLSSALGRLWSDNVNQQTDATLDQTDEDILTYDLSDEALEAAAGTERGPLCASVFNSFCGRVGPC
jgi:hypothetical protein